MTKDNKIFKTLAQFFKENKQDAENNRFGMSMDCGNRITQWEISGGQIELPSCLYTIEHKRTRLKLISISSWISRCLQCPDVYSVVLTCVRASCYWYPPDLQTLSSIIIKLNQSSSTVYWRNLRHLLGLDEIKSESINCYKWNVTALNVI